MTLIPCLQNILLIIGGICLGLTSGFFFVAILLGSISSAGAEPSSVGFGQYIGGLVCGAPLGAIAGLAGSLISISAREQSRLWDVFVWLGILIGIVVGIAAGFRFGLYDGFKWWGIVPAGVAGGTAGGSIVHWLQTIFVSKLAETRS